MNYLTIYNILTFAVLSSVLFVSAPHPQYLLHVFCVQDAKSQVLCHLLDAPGQYQMATEMDLCISCSFCLAAYLIFHFPIFDSKCLNSSCLRLSCLTPG